jgi:hypothetical protein
MSLPGWRDAGAVWPARLSDLGDERRGENGMVVCVEELRGQCPGMLFAVKTCFDLIFSKP